MVCDVAAFSAKQRDLVLVQRPGAMDEAAPVVKKARLTPSETGTPKRMNWNSALASSISWLGHNPKRPHTKAAKRWEKYCKTSTVQQAMEQGAQHRDLDHDYHHGFLECQKVQPLVPTLPLLEASDGVPPEHEPFPLADGPVLDRAGHGRRITVEDKSTMTDPTWLDDELGEGVSATKKAVLMEALALYREHLRRRSLE